MVPAKGIEVNGSSAAPAIPLEAAAASSRVWRASERRRGAAGATAPPGANDGNQTPRSLRHTRSMQPLQCEPGAAADAPHARRTMPNVVDTPLLLLRLPEAQKVGLIHIAAGAGVCAGVVAAAAVLLEELLHPHRVLLRLARRHRALRRGRARRRLLPVQRHEGLLLHELVGRGALLARQRACGLIADGFPGVVLARGHGLLPISAAQLVHEVLVRAALVPGPIMLGAAPGPPSPRPQRHIGVGDDDLAEVHVLLRAVVQAHPDLWPARGVVFQLDRGGRTPLTLHVALNPHTALA
mmetsp:Transcript_14151/g.39445  ORF Transcript_14151/g.39445 Transcript_14151/m.39445 type:complete len:296 (+) Transcript_14151:59-946(+)